MGAGVRAMAALEQIGHVASLLDLPVRMLCVKVDCMLALQKQQGRSAVADELEVEGHWSSPACRICGDCIRLTYRRERRVRTDGAIARSRLGRA